jgi:hypothetical protein
VVGGSTPLEGGEERGELGAVLAHLGRKNRGDKEEIWGEVGRDEGGEERGNWRGTRAPSARSAASTPTSHAARLVRVRARARARARVRVRVRARVSLRAELAIVVGLQLVERAQLRGRAHLVRAWVRVRVRVRG